MSGETVVSLPVPAVTPHWRSGVTKPQIRLSVTPCVWATNVFVQVLLT